MAGPAGVGISQFFRNQAAQGQVGSRPVNPATGTATRPVSGFKFQVICPKFGGVTSFSAVKGLEQEVEDVEYREGEWAPVKIKHPGLATYPMLVFEKGVSAGAGLIAWWEEVLNLGNGGAANSRIGLPDPQFRADISILLFDRAGEAVKRWSAISAWPKKISYDDLDASSSDILIHRLEMCHEGLTSF